MFHQQHKALYTLTRKMSSIGEIGTWQNCIILHGMHEKPYINTYEQFLVEKV